MESNTCAACGKEGGDSLKACSACNLVKYCNRDCQLSHRQQHKKECKKRAAEIYHEQLMKEVEPEECPICLLPLPLDRQETSFKVCCGKEVCIGCIHAMMMSEGGADLCPFCRELKPESNQEVIKLLNKLMDKGNATAYHQYALSYEAGYKAGGVRGLPQDYKKANELYLKAGELGCGAAYYNLGLSYLEGNGVEVDLKKAKQYWELAAMKGDFTARFNVGIEEKNTGNYRLAFKHFMISAKAGYPVALEAVTDAYKNEVGLVTKEEYADTLRSYHERRKEVKSDDRDMARVVFGTRGL